VRWSVWFLERTTELRRIMTSRPQMTNCSEKLLAFLFHSWRKQHTSKRERHGHFIRGSCSRNNFIIYSQPFIIKAPLCRCHRLCESDSMARCVCECICVCLFASQPARVALENYVYRSTRFYLTHSPCQRLKLEGGKLAHLRCQALNPAGIKFSPR
jgi:hypothetical protein